MGILLIQALSEFQRKRALGQKADLIQEFNIAYGRGIDIIEGRGQRKAGIFSSTRRLR